MESDTWSHDLFNAVAESERDSPVNQRGNKRRINKKKQNQSDSSKIDKVKAKGSRELTSKPNVTNENGN